jgi:hypothetical protein
MSTKSKKRNESINNRDSKKFFMVVGIAVLVLMLLMFLMYRSM